MTTDRTILLLRHGETDYKREDRYQGSSRLPVLTELGRRQTEEFLDYLVGMPIDRVVCSPLPRASQTLEQLGRALSPSAEIRIDSDLFEVGIGEWAGRLKSEIMREDGARLREWRTAPATFVSLDGSRPLTDLYDRASRALARITRSGPGVTLVVGHDHVNRALITGAMGVPPSCHAALPQGILALSILHSGSYQDRFELRASNLAHKDGETTGLGEAADARIVLVRHGITSGNRAKIYQGPVYDVELEDVGRDQILKLDAILDGITPICVWSSQLRRAVESAALLPFSSGVERIIDSRLNEYDYGHWTGLGKGEVETRYPEEMADFLEVRHDQPISGSEPISFLQGRVGAFLNSAWETIRTGETGVVVAHDVVIRTAIALSLGLPISDFWQFPIENGAVSELIRGSSGHIKLNRHNVLPGRLVERHDDEYF